MRCENMDCLCVQGPSRRNAEMAHVQHIVGIKSKRRGAVCGLLDISVAGSGGTGKWRAESSAAELESASGAEDHGRSATALNFTAGAKYDRDPVWGRRCESPKKFMRIAGCALDPMRSAAVPTGVERICRFAPARRDLVSSHLNTCASGETRAGMAKRLGCH